MPKLNAIYTQAYGKRRNFTVNRDHSNKNKETAMVTYTCRYSSEHLIPNPSSRSDMTELAIGIKCPLEYLQV